MSLTVKQFEQLAKKVPNVTLTAVEEKENRVEVFAIQYQKNGPTPNKMSQGLMEANQLWDERQLRPAGYIVAAGDTNDKGYAYSIMVSEAWYEEFESFSRHAALWKAQFLPEGDEASDARWQARKGNL